MFSQMTLHGVFLRKNSMVEILLLFVLQSTCYQSYTVSERSWIHFQFFFKRKTILVYVLPLILGTYTSYSFWKENTLQNIYTLSVLLYSFIISRHKLTNDTSSEIQIPFADMNCSASIVYKYNIFSKYGIQAHIFLIFEKHSCFSLVHYLWRNLQIIHSNTFLILIKLVRKCT